MKARLISLVVVTCLMAFSMAGFSSGTLSKSSTSKKSSTSTPRVGVVADSTPDSWSDGRN